MLVGRGLKPGGSPPSSQSSTSSASHGVRKRTSVHMDFSAKGSRLHVAEADELMWLMKAEIKGLYQPQLLSQSHLLASAFLITSYQQQWDSF